MPCQGQVHGRALQVPCRQGMARLSRPWCKGRPQGGAEPSKVGAWRAVGGGGVDKTYPDAALRFQNIDRDECAIRLKVRFRDGGAGARKYGGDAMLGPSAVRNMCAPREDVSVLNSVTIMIGPALDHGTENEDRYLASDNSCGSVMVLAARKTALRAKQTFIASFPGTDCVWFRPT